MDIKHNVSVNNRVEKDVEYYPKTINILNARFRSDINLQRNQ